MMKITELTTTQESYNHLNRYERFFFFFFFLGGGGGTEGISESVEKRRRKLGAGRNSMIVGYQGEGGGGPDLY